MTNLFDETGAISRNVFRFLLESEQKRAVRYGHIYSILTIAFDQVENGEIIKTLANLIRLTVRNTDVIGRMNHDRFLVILHEAEELHAMQIGERLRKRVECYNFENKDGRFKKTISVGGASFPTHFTDTEDLLFIAHEMLIIAKSGGGNRVQLPGM